MTENKDLPPESEMLFQALISQGCTVEKAQHIVRLGQKPRDRRMSWGADESADENEDIIVRH